MSNGTKDVQLDLEFAIDAAPQKLWAALTEPQIVERWLAPVRAKGGQDGAVEPATSCELVDAEPNVSVSYRWRDGDADDSLVTFSVAQAENGRSRLRVVHGRLPRSAVMMMAANANRPPLALAA